ncbi:hypothetical protein GCM10010922_13080 [Microbacterium sorbitolivorans]|nr:hypothetical protein GCM10010922_13080 [Microbacterium sorbitolivorans]
MRLTHEVRDELRNVALVQAKVKFIHEIGIENFARALLNANSLKSYHIRFFSAGEAPGHDSTETLETLASKVNELSHGTRADVSTAKTAREKFDEISRCGLWIGTSLHGYIISTSFGVPRIGLFIEKLNRYASTWQVPYPTGVKIGDLDRAVEGALASGMNRDSMVLADELAARADQNARTAVEFALRGDDPSRDIELARRRIERMTPTRASLERTAKSLRDAGARFYHSVRGS